MASTVRRQHFTYEDEWFVGMDKVLQFKVYDSDATLEQIEDGTANVVNIAGWSLSWIMYAKSAPTTAILTKTTGGADIQISNAAAGELQVIISAANTAAQTGSDGPLYFYILTRTGSGVTDVLAYGDITLRRPYP